MLPLLSPGWIISCHVLITSSEGFGFPQWLSGKESACNAGARDAGSISGLGRSLGEGMAAHSSILAWEIPWREEPGGLQSLGSQRVRNDWACTHAPEGFSWTRPELPTVKTRLLSVLFCWFLSHLFHSPWIASNTEVPPWKLQSLLSRALENLDRMIGEWDDLSEAGSVN